MNYHFELAVIHSDNSTQTIQSSEKLPELMTGLTNDGTTFIDLWVNGMAYYTITKKGALRNDLFNLDAHTLDSKLKMDTRITQEEREQITEYINSVIPKPVTFHARLKAIEEEAIAAIKAFMADRYIVKSVDLDTNNDDPEDIEINPLWTQFDNICGDFCTLTTINRDGNTIKIDAILEMRREPKEFVSYELSDLPVVALCTIADELHLLDVIV